MSRRIEIELTSAGDDGSWTWRAAGAKQPRGVLDGKLLHEGAKVGDVVRADADFEIDGIFVTAVLPPRAKRSEPERLELFGSPAETRAVTSNVSPRPRRDRERPPRDRVERGERAPSRPRERAERPPGDRRERRERRVGPTPESAPSSPSSAAPPAAAARAKPKKLQPARVHRDAVLASLPAEHQPVAEQVLRGGVPAVRHALDQENARARAEGRPEVRPDALVALAEELSPRLRAAEWRDRAEAAAADVDEIALRDLRSVVTASDSAARDEETRALATRLREGLERRLAAQRESWLDEIRRSLDDGRVVRALRVAGRPPEPGTRFPAELATRLSDAASAAMSPATAPDRWSALLDAVAASPVRRSVRPVGLPPDPGEDLLTAAKKAADRLPAIGALLGMNPSPPRRPPPRPAPPPAAGVADGAEVPVGVAPLVLQPEDGPAPSG